MNPHRTRRLLFRRWWPLLILTACSPAVPLPDKPIEDAKVLIERLKNKPRPSTLYLYARAEYYSDRGVRKGKLLAMLQRPDRLRIETLSPTDDMLSFLAASGDRFTAFARGEKRCVRGGTCPRNVSRFLPVPMTVPEVVDLLSGGLPILPHDKHGLRLNRSSGLYELRLEDSAGGWTQILHVDPFRFDVRRADLLGPDKQEIRMDLSSFKAHGRYRLPHRIRVRMPGDQVDLSLEARELEPDLVFKGDPFTMACPGGTAVEELPCLEEE